MIVQIQRIPLFAVIPIWLTASFVSMNLSVNKNLENSSLNEQNVEYEH